jgi:hypothetical protein
MKIHENRFNIYLVCALVLVLVCGCQSPEAKKKSEGSVFRIHLEAAPDTATNLLMVAKVSRTAPVSFKVENKPFLTEVDVKDARVVDALGGFAIEVQLDRKGSWLLEEYSLGYRGRHMPIYAQFMNPSDPEHTVGRWLAAPKITRHIADGLIQFTPDATRDEADQLVQGLVNTARKLKKDSVWSY